MGSDELTMCIWYDTSFWRGHWECGNEGETTAIEGNDNIVHIYVLTLSPYVYICPKCDMVCLLLLCW